MKKNLNDIFCMDYDIAKVLYSCKSVAHLGSRILNINIHGTFGVGNIHINSNGTEKRENVIPMASENPDGGQVTKPPKLSFSGIP